MRYDLAAIEARIAVGTWELPSHLEFKVCLTDHRGRIFDSEFFLDSDWSKPGIYVWGFSRSGKERIVAWPARAEKGHRCCSPTRRFGWMNESKAQVAADALSEAVAYIKSKRTLHKLEVAPTN